MDRREEQLIAAAEAVRTWVYAQRATWSEDDPHAFDALVPQAVDASAAALTLPSSLVVDDVPAVESSIDPRVRTTGLIEQLRARASQGADVIARSASLIRQSWRTSAMAILLLTGAWAVPTYWSDMKAMLTANVAAGRRAVNSRREALTESATSGGPKTAADPQTAAKSGGLQVESSPVGATVSVDGRDRGVTPLMVEGLSPGSHNLVIRAAEGSVQRTISITRGGIVQLNEAIFSGWLHVSSPLEIQLSDGRRAITLDDRNQALLAAGPHEVHFDNRALGVHEVRRVEVRPGETTSIAFEPPASHLSVTASEGATVAIDGEPAGETPLVDYPVQIGTRDLTITNTSGDVRRQTITVTVEPAHIEVDFSKR